MGRKLVPFAALRAFEALVRRKTLSAAAEELLISPSAVSHQIRALEAYIGAKLLKRDASGMTLTDEGRILFSGYSEALDKIEASTVRVMNDARSATLTVNVHHSLAELWLIPQLDDFLANNPEVSVKFVTRRDITKISGTAIDLAIRYADAPPADPWAEKLIDEVIYPVVSPGFLKVNGPIETPHDLIGQRLIGCETDMSEWRFWFRSIGVDAEIGSSQLVFDTRSQALQAAAEGLGAAINRRPSGDLMIQHGALVAPFDAQAHTGGAYYLIVPERSASLHRVKCFSGWLKSICIHLRDDSARAR